MMFMPHSSFPIANGYRIRRTWLRLVYGCLLFTLALYADAVGLLLLSTLGGTYCLATWFQWFRLPNQAIRLSADGVQLPAILVGLRGAKLSYSDILYIAYTPSRSSGRWLLTTRKRAYAVPSQALKDSAAIVELQKVFYEGRQRTEEGQSWLRKLELNRLHLRAFRHLSTLSTKVLVGLILIGYVAEIKVGAIAVYTFLGGDALKLLSLGAYSGALTGPEHWYRLVATMFLHGGLIHLYINGIALWAVGGVTERLLGRSRYLLVFLLSGAIAAYVSGEVRDGETLVGASAGICGLIGAFWCLGLYGKSPIPQALRQPSLSWWSFLGINAGIVVLVPQIDWIAHVVGFIVGAVLTWLFVNRDGRLFVEGYGLKILSMVVAGAALACLVQAVKLVQDEGDRRLHTAILNAEEPVPATYINEIAWGYVLNQSATDGELRAALSAGERALQRSPDDFHLRDTVASLHFRLAQVSKARDLAWEVFEDAHKSHLEGDPLAVFGVESDFRGVFATQFYRFYRDEQRDTRQQVVWTDDGQLDVSGLTQFAGQQAFFVVHQGDKILGTLWLFLAKNIEENKVSSIVEYRPPPGQLSLLTVRPWLDDASGVGYWALDEEVMSMPVTATKRP